jgi:acyl carrier protein
MSDIQARLARCFQAVFVDLDPAQISEASTSTVASWDSLNHINLLTVIGEEFGVEVDYEESAELTSYAAMAEHLNRRLAQ